ncbi:hypothetical protein Pan241w_07930 [Gimesia alba]|uniref:Uncharacterized protein n=1 Tax=Gimesia alba TaxID=2527973 RepID=A0A517RA32_9PLAN|nr:hypothetical protein Pan241w_07930 [Gimesia alba]
MIRSTELPEEDQEVSGSNGGDREVRPQRNRKSSGWICLFCLLACPQLSAEPPQQQNDNENVPKRTEIHFDDLQKKYRIIGRLGKPVGEFHTIHGTWKRFNFSGRQLFFQITHVNFQKLPEPQLYPERHFKLAHLWATSKLNVDPDHSPICEYRVWESLEYFGTPDDFWDESKLPPSISILPGFAGREKKAAIPLELTSELNYVKAKVLKQNEVKEKLENSTFSESRAAESSINPASDQTGENRDKVLIDIGFYDLRDRYQIIGKLGKPLGEYSTIRGVWKRERATIGQRIRRFHRFYVTHIDGQELDKSVIINHRWDTISSYGVMPFKPAVPDPEETEVWEMRVVELMRNRGLAAGFNGEAGLIEQHNSFFELVNVLRYHRRPSIIKGEGFKRVLKP